ncbi:Lcp65Ac [Carabus blaptoides fortunei]
MKCVLLTMCLFINVVLAQRDQGKNAKILIFENVQGIGGEYMFEFETSDGTRREETGKIETNPDGTESQVVHGSYSYIGDNEVIYTVNYMADKNGYRLIKMVPSVSYASPARAEKRINSALLGSLIGSGIR